MPINIQLPNGQVLEVDTDSEEAAVNAAKQYLLKNPISEEEAKPPAEEAKPPEEEQGTFREISEGIGAGLIGIPQGIAELGAAGVDLIADTNTSRAVTKTFEDFKNYLGLDPTTTAGKAAEGITNFAGAAIPVVGWLSRASKAAQAAKAGLAVPGVSAGAGRLTKAAQEFGKSKAGQAALGTRPRQAVTTTMAAGVSDFFVAPDGTKTIADAFDVLPDTLQTEDDTMLYGREEAGRRIRNKLRQGAEGVGIGAAFEAAFPVAKYTLMGVAQTPGVSQSARAIASGVDKLKGKLEGTKLQEWFSSRGLAPREINEEILATQGTVDAAVDIAGKTLSNFDNSLKKAIRGTFKNPFRSSSKEVSKGYEDLWKVLQGEDVNARAMRDAYGDNAADAALQMRSQVDSLSDQFFKEIEGARVAGRLSDEQASDMAQTFHDNLGGYISRAYEVFLRPEKVIKKGMLDTPQGKAAIDEVAQNLSKTDAFKNLSKEQLDFEARATIVDIMTNSHRKMGGGGSPDDILADFVKQKQAARKRKGEAANVPLFELSEGLFKDRSKLLDKGKALRSLMGEIKNPREAYLRTVGKMSETLAGLKFSRELAKDAVDYRTFLQKVAANPDFKPNIIKMPTNAEEAKGAAELIQQLKAPGSGYRQLGSQYTNKGTDEQIPTLLTQGSFGELSGSFVSDNLYKVLTNRVQANTGAETALALALQAKGLSQIGRTVLNPLAQVRNALSGAFLLGATGNVARNMDVSDSFRLTMSKPANLSDQEFKQLFEDLGILGVRDQNIFQNEYRRLLKEGAEGTVASKTGEVLQRLSEEAPIFKQLQTLYSGTDTFWKVANLMGERAKWSASLRKAGISPDMKVDPATGKFLDESQALLMEDLLNRGIIQTNVIRRAGEDRIIDPMLTMSAEMTTRMMPTYSRVPEVIRQIRRIPVVGNFIAFPAEIIRNTANITEQAIREMGYKASDDLIKAIGVKEARILEREIRTIGAQRASSYLASAYLIPMATQKAALEMTDMSEEQLEAMKSFLPEWARDNIIIPMQNPSKGIADFVDLSYMMPYDFATQPMRAAMRAYEQKGVLTDNEVEKLGAGVWGAFSTYMEPFLGESLVAERVQDVLPLNYFGRDGKTSTGATIYEGAESTGDKLQKSFTHVLGGFQPGFLDPIVQERRGELKYGRGLRAVTGEISPSGERTTKLEELTTMLSGLRRMQIDVPGSFRFVLGEYKGDRSSAAGLLRRVISDRGSSAADIASGYNAANESLFRVQKQLYKVVQDAKRLGMDDGQIEDLFVENGVGREEADYILNGEFRPLSISSALEDRLEREGEQEGRERVVTEVPDELYDLRDKFEFRRLDEPEDLNQEPQAVAPAPQPVAPAPQTSAPIPAPQAGQRTNVSPILVPDPATRATFGLQ